MALRIALLGRFSLSFDGVAVAEATRARVQDLAAWLILHRAAPSPRRVVASALWPDVRDEQALKNLRTLLTRLRDEQPLLAPYLHVDGEMLQLRLDPSCTIDVLRFEEARAQALHALSSGEHAAALHALAEAAAHYGGDLLPGHDDEWIRLERERLRRAWIDTLDQRARLLSTSGAYIQAQEVARQLLHADPLHESAYASLMRSQLALGDRAGALRSYHACAALLREELGVDPGVETQLIYQDVLFADHAGTGNQPARLNWVVGPERPTPFADDDVVAGAPLIGRAEALAWLRERWYVATAGTPHVALLSGEAGMGKTRVATEFGTWVERAAGGDCAFARCYTGAGTIAFAPIADWLRSAAGARRARTLDTLRRAEAARLTPELFAEDAALVPPEPITQSWQGQHFSRAVAAAIVGDGRAGLPPLLLILEDVQWGDAETLTWLPILLSVSERRPLLVLATLRIEEGPDNEVLMRLLHLLRRSGQVDESLLPPLDRAQCAELATSLTGIDQNEETARRLFRDTEGNPLFIVEMVRAGLDRSYGNQDDFDAENDRTLDLPPAMLAALRYRFDQLTPKARDLVACAAVLGREFRYDHLAAASQMDEETIVLGLDELWRRRIVREQGAFAYDFSHDKLRAVVYDSLSQARRRMMHRRSAEALMQIHGDATVMSAQIAAHFDSAKLGKEAILHYCRAADEAQRVFANEDAIRYYRRALALMEEDEEGRQRKAPILLEGLADVYLRINQPDEARAAYQLAISYLSVNDRIVLSRLQRKIGQTWRGQFQFQDALRSYGEAEATLGARLPIDADDITVVAAITDWWHEWIQVLLEIEFAHYWLGHFEVRDELMARLLLPVERYGTPDQYANYLHSGLRLEFGRNGCKGTEEMVATAIKALKVCQAAGAKAAEPWAHFIVGFYTLWSGAPQAAEEPLNVALALTEENGDAVLRTRCLTYLALAGRQLGRIEETEQTAVRALTISRAVALPEYSAMALGNLAWVAWRLGHFEEARDHGLLALEAWAQRPVGFAGNVLQWIALFPLIAVATHFGDVEAAIVHMRIVLAPEQHRLPEALTILLGRILQEWESDPTQDFSPLLLQATSLASELRYL